MVIPKFRQIYYNFFTEKWQRLQGTFVKDLTKFVNYLWLLLKIKKRFGQLAQNRIYRTINSDYFSFLKWIGVILYDFLNNRLKCSKFWYPTYYAMFYTVILLLLRSALAFFIRIFFTSSPNVTPDFSLMYLEMYGLDKKNFSARSSNVISI